MNLPTRQDIALIAAALVQQATGADETARLASASRTALRLLEAADFAASEINARDAFTDEGLKRWEQREDARTKRQALEAKLPELERSSDGLVSWEEFERHLRPSKPRNDRLPRFKLWLMHFETLDKLEAADRIASYKTTGIPEAITRWYFWSYGKWWEQMLRTQKSEAGKKGNAAKPKKNPPPHSKD